MDSLLDKPSDIDELALVASGACFDPILSLPLSEEDEDLQYPSLILKKKHLFQLCQYDLLL